MQDPAYLVLLDPISLLGREFGDEAHPRVSTRRAYNLFLGSRLPMGSFLALLHEAAGRTRASRSAITTYRTGDASRQKNLVPFLFATLERLIQEQQISQYSSGVATRGSPTRRDPQSSQTSNYCEAPSRLAANTRDADDTDPLWHRVLNELAAVVVPSVFETWLAPTRSLGREGCCLRVEVPSVFHRQWLAARMSRQVESALTLLGHAGMKVVFVERKN